MQRNYTYIEHIKRTLLIQLITILLSGCSTTLPRIDDVINPLTAISLVEKIRCDISKVIKEHNTDYDNTILTSQVNFDITKNSNANSKFILSIPIITGDTFTLEYGGTNNLMLREEREIRVSDKFEELRKLGGCKSESEEKNKNESKNKNSRTKKYPIRDRYPIRGNVGVDEVIDSYIKLAELSSKNNGVDFIKNYSDTVTFTTEINHTPKPSITISKVTGESLSADLTLKNRRLDKHSLLLIFTPAEKPLSKNEEKEAEYQKRLDDRLKNIVEVMILKERPKAPHKTRTEEGRDNINDAKKVFGITELEVPEHTTISIDHQAKEKAKDNAVNALTKAEAAFNNRKGLEEAISDLNEAIVNLEKTNQKNEAEALEKVKEALSISILEKETEEQRAKERAHERFIEELNLGTDRRIRDELEN